MFDSRTTPCRRTEQQTISIANIVIIKAGVAPNRLGSLESRLVEPHVVKGRHVVELID